MERFAVIADVHGNLPALEAVLAELDVAGIGDVVCLGDLVGFCADPNACVAVARARGFDCIAGNHDRIALGKMGFERCGLAPAHALARTRVTLDAESRQFLEKLPGVLVRGDMVFVHGTLGDPCTYMTGEEEVLATEARLRAAYADQGGARVCFFGHTHVACVHRVHHGRAVRSEARGTLRLEPEGTWFINPGAIDGSRAPEQVARFAIVDARARTVEFKRALYDHASVEAEARRQGYRRPRAAVAWHASLSMARAVSDLLVRAARGLR